MVKKFDVQKAASEIAKVAKGKQIFESYVVQMLLEISSRISALEKILQRRKILTRKEISFEAEKIKKLLGKTITIAGNVPAGLLLTGTAGEVKAYCKNLIDVVGKDGGYMMANGTGMDEGKPETVHAMIDFTKEYGVYK